jgi:hypothetical protein
MQLEAPRAIPRHPAFTLDQVATITRWSCSRPLGLRVRIATHHQDFLEVAEIFFRHPPSVLYLMNPTDCGTVFLVRSSGGAWELGTLELAFAKVLTLEAARLGA